MPSFRKEHGNALVAPSISFTYMHTPMKYRKQFFPILLVGMIITFISPALSQRFSEEYWHHGEIDLTSGETLKGKVRYNLTENTLEYQNNKGAYRTYNPRMVEAWQIQDALTGEVRVFYSLYFSTEGLESRQPIFFELLTDGEELILFTRRQVETRMENVYDPFWIGGRNINVTVERENYFLLDAVGKLHPCDDDIGDFINLMEDREGEVRSYIKRNKLRAEIREDMIALVNYYNAYREQ